MSCSSAFETRCRSLSTSSASCAFNSERERMYLRRIVFNRRRFLSLFYACVPVENHLWRACGSRGLTATGRPLQAIEQVSGCWNCPLAQNMSRPAPRPSKFRFDDILQQVKRLWYLPWGFGTAYDTKRLGAVTILHIARWFEPPLSRDAALGIEGIKAQKRVLNVGQQPQPVNGSISHLSETASLPSDPPSGL